MDINDIEDNLGTVPIDPVKLIPELYKLAIHNNSLLRVILSNQADILSRLDPETDKETLEEAWIQVAIQTTQELNLKILSKLSK